MDEFLRQDPAIDTRALLDLTEANLSPLSSDQAWEAEIGFLRAAEEDRDQELTILVSAAINESTLLA